MEGHVLSVLVGADPILAEVLHATIHCEDRSPALQNTLSAADFEPCAFNPFSRQLRPDVTAHAGNQLWLRNLAWSQDRLQTAPTFSLLGERI